MAKRSWILTDTPNDLHHDTFSMSARELGLPPGVKFTVSKRTLQGGLRDGVEVVEVDNGALRFTLLPTRGMGIWRGEYRGLRLGWDSPVQGPVHPAFVNLGERGGLGWLQGFDEWICRCGLESNGAPCRDTVLDNNGNPSEIELPLHGKLSNLPAHYLRLDVRTEPPFELSVTGRVAESMLFSPSFILESRVTTWPGSNRMSIEDRVANNRATAAEFELLYHCNFGPPLLEAGSQLVAPVREAAPRDARAAEDVDGIFGYLEPQAGYVEQVYWHRLAGDPESGNTLAVLRNAAGDAAAALRFNLHSLPWFTQWKNTGAPAEGYVTGLEPGTDLTNARPFERARGRLMTIDPSASYSCGLVVEVAGNREQVESLEHEVQTLQAGSSSVVNRQPMPELSPL